MTTRRTLPLVAAAACLLAGCDDPMRNQPRYEPLEAAPAFPDNQSALQPVEGTVARGEFAGAGASREDTTASGAITRELLAHGRERYDIYCSPCHSLTGDGDGMIVQRGYTRPPSFHSYRLREAPDSHFFAVITNGFGAMPDYGYLVPPPDRRAIIAYIRALQLSRRVRVEDLPAAARQRLAEETP